jgi:AhpD family alkylhydroperoxidase
MPTSPSDDAAEERRILPAAPAEDGAGKAAEDQIMASRGKITPLYRILLNSLPVACGWEQLLTAIRQKMALDPAIRELVILRVAVLNGADYEFDAHVPFAKKAGLSEAKIAAVKTMDAASFDERERAVLDYTDAMTRDIRVPDAVFARIRDRFDQTGRVELTATVAAYNMVSRFLIALDVH